MAGEPTEGRRRIMLRRGVAVVTQVVSIALTIAKIAREWILPQV